MLRAGPQHIRAPVTVVVAHSGRGIAGGIAEGLGALADCAVHEPIGELVSGRIDPGKIVHAIAVEVARADDRPSGRVGTHKRRGKRPSTTEPSVKITVGAG